MIVAGHFEGRKDLKRAEPQADIKPVAADVLRHDFESAHESGKAGRQEFD